MNIKYNLMPQKRKKESKKQRNTERNKETNKDTKKLRNIQKSKKQGPTLITIDSWFLE